LHKITFIAARPWSGLGGPTHKGNAFTQPVNHKELELQSQWSFLVFEILNFRQINSTQLIPKPKVT